MFGRKGTRDAGSAKCILILIGSVVNPRIVRLSNLFMKFDCGLQIQFVELVGADGRVSQVQRRSATPSARADAVDLLPRTCLRLMQVARTDGGVPRCVRGRSRPASAHHLHIVHAGMLDDARKQVDCVRAHIEVHRRPFGRPA